MAINAAHWTVTRSNGNIRYIGDDHVRFGGSTPSYATVLELHRWLQGLADDASSTGDDELAIYDVDSSARSTDNIIRLKGNYNIDDNAAEHLYDGSIIQGTGGTEVYYDGIVNFGNSDVLIQLIQNGAVITDDWWNLSAGGGLNASAAQGISHRFLIKVRNAGADIDGRRIIGTTREFGKTYAEFRINGSNRGNNVLALSNSTDLNNGTAEGTVATWTTITNTTEGYASIDVDNNGTPENYYSEWNRDTYTINQYYERMKWLTRDGSTSTLYGLNGELFRGITHELSLTTPRSGTFAAFEAVSWTGGTGQMFAIDSTTAGTKMWIQVLTGTAPGSGVLITGASTATATTSGTATERPLSFPFVGTSTGTAIIGSYGLGIEKADLTANDKVFDLTNTQITPPNQQTFTVSGLVSAEDRVLVAPWDGSSTDAEGNPAIDIDQLTLQTSLSSGTETAVVVTASIPSDTPASGKIRIQLNSGNYKEQSYTSWTGSTFTIPSTSFVSDPATAPKNVWIAYIDKDADATTASFTAVYSSDRNLVGIVRDGKATPIKEYITPATFTSAGGGFVATRTTDL